MTPLQFVQCRKRSRASVIEQRAKALAFMRALRLALRTREEGRRANGFMALSVPAVR
jgi:hypothetical protein